MTTYILQFNSKTNRTIIDTKLHSEYESKGEMEANTWVQAKYNFGYPLTNIQQDMLN